MVEKQSRFVKTVAMFIKMSTERGYLFTFGEAWRPDFVAAYYDKKGTGIRNSLHRIRLAIDLNVFYNGSYLDASEVWHIPHLEVLGKLWESLDKEAAWGGRFDKKDYNHYSFHHEGVK